MRGADTFKVEVTKDGKWIMSIALNEESIEKVVGYAELLQYNEIEGLDTSEVDSAIIQMLEEQ